MSTDRELLELAAKAAGIEIKGYDGTDENNPVTDFTYTTVTPWNPLTDDGDALRLAAKLKVDIDWQGTKPFPEPNVEAYRSNGDEGSFCATEHEDDYRRAIVRAAAEIGRAMP